MQQFIDSHDLSVVALSYLVSVLGAFVALYVADYIADEKGNIRFGWLTLASVVFGGCAIWAMHFTGMLAFEMEFAASYDVSMTLLSLALPIVLAGAGFLVAYKWQDSTVAWLSAGTVFGLGVAAMHYLGMQALRTEAMMHHDTMLVAISVGIAVVAATAALRIVVHWRGMLRLVSPFVMGLAVCGMHYTGMAAMEFMPMSDGGARVDYFDGAWSASFMGFAAGLAVFLTLLVGSALVMFRKALDLEPEFATN
ncbi:MAG: signal protein [Xanthomonadales bacterium]|nr:signal protein [Xanthomonadales bacterium]|tara:strand:- start:1901 stop:2656 length:756 start_codon:yes stop_codon:yes gene_type:complete